MRWRSLCGCCAGAEGQEEVRGFAGCVSREVAVLVGGGVKVATGRGRVAI